jgi:hypothetical protein
MIKVGQTVRVFGVIKNSWILGKVSSILDSAFVRVVVEDWVGIPKGFETEVPTSQIEVISGGKN